MVVAYVDRKYGGTVGFDGSQVPSFVRAVNNADSRIGASQTQGFQVRLLCLLPETISSIVTNPVALRNVLSLQQQVKSTFEVRILRTVHPIGIQRCFTRLF